MNFPEEILRIILKKLQKKNELLNTRLVSHLWNKQVLAISKNNSKYTQTLTDKNAKDFIDFSQNVSAEVEQKKIQLILPFRLKWGVPVPVADAAAAVDYEIEENVHSRFDHLTKTIESLQKLFGVNCIQILEINYAEISFSELCQFVQILKKISSHLKHLVLKTCKLVGEIPESGEIQLQKILIELAFPNLIKLSFTTMTLPGVGNLSRIQAKFCSELITRSPNLKMLSLPAHMIGEEWTKEMLNPNLEYLNIQTWADIPIPTEEEKMTMPWPLPTSLQTLKVRSPDRTEDFRHMNRFFQNFLPFWLTLQNLEFCFYIPHQINGDAANPNLAPIPITFPKFPLLKKMKLNYADVENLYFLRPDLFPRLESLEMTFSQLRLRDSTISDQDRPEVIEIPTMKHLILNNWGSGVLGGDGYQKCFEFLFMKKFTNLVRVTINNQSLNPPNGTLVIVSIIREFIQAFGCGEGAANTIEEIEINDCEENYLGQILSQYFLKPKIVLENIPRNYVFEREAWSNFTLFFNGTKTVTEDEFGKTIIEGFSNQSLLEKLTKIKRIKLTLSAEVFQKRRSNPNFNNTSLPQKSFDLISIAKSFSNLEVIEISSTMFGTEITKGKKEIEMVHAEFPNLKISLV